MQSHSCLEEKQKTQVCGNEIMECVFMCLWSRDVVCDNNQICLPLELSIARSHTYTASSLYVCVCLCVCTCVCVCVCVCVVVMNLTSALRYITHAMCHILIYTVLLQGLTQLPRGITNCKC